ncbi:MAG: baseplate J/gp47 family protein, partial [Spirochaetales bacterium]|nr:baseplate J/gp47 family protein [Spirochaetales bacterium]
MIDFTLFDAETEMDNLVEQFELASGESLYEGDERETILKCMLYMMETLMQEINTQTNNQFALFCDEPHLIYMGAQQNTYRLQAEPATVTEKFTVSSLAPDNVTIPAGTRVTADGITFFATDEAVTIAPNSNASVKCTATEAGAQGNGYSTGQITVLVDVIPYVESVTNTDTSAGGADQQSLEDFREDVQYAPLKYNTAGSEGGYIYKTKSVSASIADVAVT